MFDASLPQSFYGSLPNRQACTLYLKTATGDPDTYATGVSVWARRRPSNENEVARAGVTAEDEPITFSILNDGSSTTFVAPQTEAKLTGPDGVNWRIRTVKSTIFDTLFVCVCTRMWG